MTTPPSSLSIKPEFWRIRNIKTSERDDARKWLQAQVEELAISEGQGFSLVSDSERTLCATLTSRKRPTPSTRHWHVDKDFVGLTPLCGPEDADVDIIAVTGLGGHAVGSFRSKDGMCVWLRDFAPQDVTRARFITYGYDTAVVASNNNQGVHELARTLLDGLANFRHRTRTQHRPLLFVCHSLGGIVLKETLVMASKATEAKHKKLLEVTTMTYGLVFMGVPNLGLKHNQLETIVKGQRNEGFVRDLLVRSDGEASQYLSSLTSDFSDLDRRRRLPFEIVSYYETVSSPTVVDSGGGRFVTEGPRELMVTKTSAERIGHLVRNIDHLASDTDHRGLVKFEHPQDLRYISVIEKLKKMVADAPQALQSRAGFGYFGGEIQASQSSTRPTYLPFPPNKRFTGRKYEIDALEHELFVDGSCRKTAIVGLGGVGKTQVALQFAYLAREKYSGVSVFWVPAMSSEAFEQACREIAGVLGILDAEDGEADVKELVRRHLSTKNAGKWLLIVDNADDTGVLECSGGEKGILDHLPTSELGMTVFTTRDWKTAYTLAGNNIVCVGELDPRTASDLFKASVRPELLYNETVADKLLVELNYLPLAITQAAAYINCNAVSVEEYLDHVEDTEMNLIHIISEEMGDHTRYKNAGNAVAKTWLVSFDQIVRQDVDAANLLQYMSCVEWKAIPRSILPAIKPEARMTTAIGTLCSYSFITIRNDRKTYDMHRLVHIAAQVWIQQKGLTAETQKTALEHLSTIFPTDDYDNREVWREFIPHAARMRDRYSNTGGELCLQVGRCLRVDGRMRDAIDWLEKSRDLRSDLSEDHAGRLLTQHVLAMAYRANGMVNEAVRLLEQVVAIHKRVLAKDHPNRLASQHELASAYRANGQINKGLQLIEQVVAIRERVLVEDHPHRLTSQHELASAYQATGQVKEAVRLLEHVVAVRERVLAEDHPDRLTSQQLLASAYWANRQAKEAIGLLEHVSVIREQVLAEDHPDRLASQHELASAYNYNVDKQPNQLDSRPLAQAGEHGVGPSRARRLAVESEKSLPHRSRTIGAPFHDGSLEVIHEREGARGDFTRLWQKLTGRK